MDRQPRRDMGNINLFRSGTSLSISLFASLLAGALAWLTPATGRAEQFDLFDVMYTYTQSDAVNAKPNKSHFYVRSQMNPLRPKDWTAPVDYRNGTVHIRTEVIDMPSPSVPMAWTLCYIPYKGIAGGYGCTNTSVYSQKGVYERDVGMTTWWQNQDIVWNMGIMGMDLVLKDDKGVFSHLRPDPEHFFPQTVHITMTQVSKDATYVPTKYPPPVGTGSGGSSGADAAPPPPLDGGNGGDAAAGTGGASGGGTGGSGTGGASATGGPRGVPRPPPRGARAHHQQH